MTNLQTLHSGILKELEQNKINLNNCINIDEALKIIFTICSQNNYNFSILREEYGKCKVIIFDKNSIKTEKFTITFILENNNIIYKIKAYNYKKLYNLRKLLRIIPIIGPDGVGKTTLIQETIKYLKIPVIQKRFKKIVRRSVLYNLIHPINKNILRYKYGKKLEKDQHDDLNSKLIISAGLIYYPYLMILTLFKNKPIIVDRFFSDTLLENISFRDKQTRLRSGWKIALIFIPKTFWIVHLDAKEETILKRKDELSADDVEQYRKLNFEIYLKNPALTYSYINTENSIEVCKDHILHIGRYIQILK